MKTLLYFCLLVPSLVFAKELRIVQVDKTFFGDISDAQAAEAFDNPLIEKDYKIEKLNAKVGDTLNFNNRDEVAHNVSGTMPEKVIFDVKLQEPGAKNDRKILLDKAGDYTIQCAIHPKMKLNIKVD